MTNPLRPVIVAAHRVLCATRGHDTLLQIEPHRLSLRCVSCGHQTAGWTIGEPVARETCSGVAARARRRVEASHAV